MPTILNARVKGEPGEGRMSKTWGEGRYHITVSTTKDCRVTNSKRIRLQMKILLSKLDKARVVGTRGRFLNRAASYQRKEGQSQNKSAGKNGQRFKTKCRRNSFTRSTCVARGPRRGGRDTRF